MKIREHEAGNIGLIVIAVVVGLVVGFTVARVIGVESGKTSKESSVRSSSEATGAATKAADLRATLVAYGVEHQQLTQQAVNAALDGSKSAAAYAEALNVNGENLGAAVGSVYGKDAETTFNNVWQIHLDQFVNYAVAASKNNEAAKKTALSTIDTEYTKPLSAYLAKANPNLPENTLYKQLDEHVQMTAALIDQHVAGKYADETAGLAKANAHIAKIMSTLADGIVKQFPDKF